MAATVAKVAAWPLVKLRRITSKIGSGATPKGGKESYKEGGITLIRSLNVYDFEFDYEGLAFIDEEQAKQLANVEVCAEDILLNITGASVARCCMVPKRILPARVNQHVSIVRIDRVLADPSYVLYCLNSPRYKQHLLTIAQGGATREALTKEKIGNFEIPLPRIQEQRKIAAILSAYDDLIENNLRRIQILDEMAQLIYREWFVNFRFPRHEGVRMIDSETGRIPEGWEVRRLGELVDIVKGRKAHSLYHAINADRVPYLLIDGLRNGKYVYSDKNAGPNAKEGDVLMVMDGASSGEVFIGFSGVIGSTLAIFRPRNVTLLSPYVLFLMFRERKREIAVKNVGAAIPHANKAYITGIELTVPPKDVSMTLHSQLQPFFQQMIMLRLKNANLRQTRDLLLPKLISGKLDVSELDIDIGEEPA